MSLFRSTFITALAALILCLAMLSASASAMPQFGKPYLHVWAGKLGESAVPYASSTASAVIAEASPAASTNVTNAAISWRQSAGGMIGLAIGGAAAFITYVL